MDKKASSVDNNNIEPEKIPHLRFNIRYIGVLSSILASLFGSASTIFAKMTSANLITFAAYRNYTHYLAVVPLIFCLQSHDRILGPTKLRSRVFLWLQGTSLAFSALFYYLTLSKVSAGNTITLASLNMIFTPLLARAVFKASLTIVDCIFAITCFIGVVLIAKPPFLFHHLQSTQSEDYLGVIYGVLAALFGSFSYILLCKIGHRVHFINSLFSSTVVGILLCTVLMFLTNNAVIPCRTDLLLVAIVSFFMFLQNISLVIALQNERAGTVAILQSPQIIIVYISEALFLHTIPPTLTLIGSGLIFATSICVGVRKIVNEKRKEREIN